ncbi:IS1595 family transposase [Ferruginibacter albus]|uniref:IS1595 family transposase n=1 Tax=Ferruginibacter albus TaxID=2875540 RepID=UPI001CC57A37|nr:IS1595 family transposase [Ferruginibacter albus]UAY53659.1 IS1595 family transposase [Ferruginibacter albus]
MLNLTPFNSLIQLLQAFPDENSCIKHLEILRWNGKVISPFKAGSKVYKCANNRYKCKDTNKYFNVCTGTLFENKKISLQQWFVAVYLFAAHKGISSYKLAADLQVSQKTGWFVLQRLRFALRCGVFTKYLEGIVEVDETFVGGKNKNRHWDKKVKNNQGRSFKDKTPVAGILQRGGEVRCFVVPDTKAENIQPLIFANVKAGSIIYSDEWFAYNGLGRHYDHSIIDHSRKQYKNGETCTNNIEGFWSHFKRGIIGTYYHASRKHLQGYADEYSFRYNNRQVPIDEKFNILLRSAQNKRITYKNLTAP